MSEKVCFVLADEEITVPRVIVDVSGYAKNLLNNLSNFQDNGSSCSGSLMENDMDASDNEIIKIPILNISFETMKLIIHWCEHFYETHKEEIDYGYFKDASHSTNIYDNWIQQINQRKDQEDLIYELNNISTIDTWNRHFLNVDPETLQSIILAANFLDIKPLLHIIMQWISEIFRGKSPHEVITAFSRCQNNVPL